MHWKYRIKLIVKPSAKFKELAHRKIDSFPDNETSCVYMIPITNKVKQKKLKYISMTTRKLRDRLKEDLPDIKYNKPSTALSKLNQKQDIDIGFSKTGIIAHTSLYYISIISESYENLNKGRGYFYDMFSYNINLIWYNILKISREFGA